MKGFAEFRGVQSRLGFDASSGSFKQLAMEHEFERVAVSHPALQPEADVISIPVRKVVRKMNPPARKTSHTSAADKPLKRVG